jgi:hypothetical protein
MHLAHRLNPANPTDKLTVPLAAVWRDDRRVYIRADGRPF